MKTPMIVHCTLCSTALALPDHLLGSRGARVRCPNCAQSFVVLREGATTVNDAKHAVVPAATPGPAIDGAVDGADAAIAREILTALSTRVGNRLEAARASGRVLAELGPDLMAAFDEYRRRAGAGASSQVFQSELRERWGVDLRTGAAL